MVDAADLHTASQIREQVAWQQLLDDMTKLIISHVKHTDLPTTVAAPKQ